MNVASVCHHIKFKQFGHILQMKGVLLDRMTDLMAIFLYIFFIFFFYLYYGRALTAQRSGGEGGGAAGCTRLY